MRNVVFRSVILLAVAGLQSACETIPPTDGARIGPFFSPANVRGIERMPAAVRRIALLPTAGNAQISEESLIKLDESLLAELTRTARAETVAVPRELLARLAGARQVDSTTALPHDLLSKIKAVTQADAVVFVDVTSYSAYPPLMVGIRSKLVDLSTADILWAFDSLFDASIPMVRNAARRHQLADAPNLGMKADMTTVILQNPTRYAAYVGAAMFATLPRR